MSKTNISSNKQGHITVAGCLVLGAFVGWAIQPEYIIQGLVIGLGIGLVAFAILNKGRRS